MSLKSKWTSSRFIRVLLGGGLVVGGGLGWVLFKNGHQDRPSEVTIRFGVQPATASAIVAYQKGWLAQALSAENVKIKVLNFPSGPPLAEALTAERVDFGILGSQPALQAIANHVPIQAIGFYAGGKGFTGLLASPQSQVQKLADLRGKKIGVAVGSGGHEVLLTAIKQVGLTANDVHIVNLGPGDQLTALQAGQIDAISTWEPYITLAQSKAHAHVIPLEKPLRPLVSPIVATSAILQKHPQVASILLKQLDLASQWILQYPDSTVQIIAKFSGYDAAILKPLLQYQTGSIAFDQERVESISQTVAFLQEQKVLRSSIDLKTVLNDQYLVAAGLQNQSILKTEPTSN